MTWTEYRARFGVEFEADNSDFDTFHLAALVDPEVGQLWVMNYDNAPGPLTKYVIDVAFTRQQGLAAIRRVLGDVDLDWVSPLDRHGAELPAG